MWATCAQCGVEFSAHPCRVKRLKSSLIFCSQHCYNIWRRLNHPCLGSGRFHPSKEELESLYLVQRFSTNKIAEMYRISSSLVSRWIKRYNIPSRWPNLANLEPSGNLWYVVGVMVGDGCFDNSRFGVKLGVRNETFAVSFRAALQRLELRTHKWVQTHEGKPMHVVTARSKSLFLWLKQTLSNLDVPNQFIGDFLRGFYESEGCLYKSSKWKNYFQLFFSNTDEDLILLAKKLIEAGGYRASLFKRKQHGWGTKPVYSLYVLGSTEEKLKFLKWVNPSIKRV